MKTSPTVKLADDISPALLVLDPWPRRRSTPPRDKQLVYGSSPDRYRRIAFIATMLGRFTMWRGV
jgi:hypothetical protein